MKKNQTEVSYLEIKNLPVHKITDEKCILFLWTTSPMLQQSFEVIKAWGFIYKLVGFVWIKLNPTGKIIYNNKNIILEKGIYSGMGHWVNTNAEFCLIATKDKFPSRIKKNVKQIVLAPRGKHSVKPAEVRDRIISLVGDISRIELFARQKTEGWDIIEGKDNADGSGQDIIDWINKNYE